MWIAIAAFIGGVAVGVVGLVLVAAYQVADLEAKRQEVVNE